MRRADGSGWPATVLLVSPDPILPGPTYSGNAVVRWGLISGLQACGVHTSFYAASQYDRRKAEYDAAGVTSLVGEAHCWISRPGPKVTEASVGALEEVLSDRRPDVVLAYGINALRLVRACCYSTLSGVMSIDLEFLPAFYRWSNALRYGGFQERRDALCRTWPTGREVLRRRKAAIRDYPIADFVVNHAAHHAAWHRLRHGRPTLYTPSPVAALFEKCPEREVAAPARFLLFGGLAGVATVAGLEWFARRVYPLIEGDIRTGRLEVHLAGRREPHFSVARWMPRVVERGYVEDITSELQRTTAVLVPTPITIGFRTRILDAFRHGVTVIAHRANSVGMPELAGGRNALVVSRGQDFADAMLKLADDRGLADRLGRQAFDDFAGDLSATVVAGRMLQFMAAQH